MLPGHVKCLDSRCWQPIVASMDDCSCNTEEPFDAGRSCCNAEVLHSQATKSGKVIWQSRTPKCFWWVTCGRLRQIHCIFTHVVVLGTGALWCRRGELGKTRMTATSQVHYHGIWSQITKRWIESPNRIKSQIWAIQIESLMVKSNPVRQFNRDLNRIAIGICPSLVGLLGLEEIFDIYKCHRDEIVKWWKTTSDDHVTYWTASIKSSVMVLLMV